MRKTHFNQFNMYQPVPRRPIESYRKRKSSRFDKYYIAEMQVSQKSNYSCTREESPERKYREDMPRLRRGINTRSSLKNDGLNSPDKITSSNNSSSDEIDEYNQASELEKSHRATSPERKKDNSKELSNNNSLKKTKNNEKKDKEKKKSSTTSLSNIIVIVLLSFIFCGIVFWTLTYRGNISENRHLDTSEKSQNIQSIQPQSVVIKILESMERVKSKFRNQEEDIWNDISSAINEIIRTPKVPSIILLFANEIATMNCLATELADVSSSLLGTDKLLYLKPEDFGDDAGKIITKLNNAAPKIVVIHDILKIKTQAIKALHNICDKINPLLSEVIYILTMHTNNYQLSQNKMTFVEQELTKTLSNRIHEDILSALRARITDGAIISVKPELHLDNC